MNPETKERQTGPGLRETLRNDLRTAGFWEGLRSDFEELQEFYLTEERRSALSRENRFIRWMKTIWWLLRETLLRLTGPQRLLVVVGLLAILLPQQGNSGSGISVNLLPFLGVLLLLFVLMLELKDRLLARDELEAGRKIQRALLPDPYPPFPGWKCALHSYPANEVGGDLVDFVRTTPECCIIAIADVAGKGLKAALVTAKIQATFRAYVREGASPTEIVGKLNRIIIRDGIPGMFASFLLAELHASDGTIRLANAGHLPPLIVGPDGIREMAKGSAALGLSETTEYELQTVELRQGEALVLYSDGVVEARNPRGEFLGTERWQEILRAGFLSSPEEASAGIVAAIDRFREKARPHDDVSFVLLLR